ncbi:hypothetical protein [Halolamina sp.]|jgi:hypothetical protein|uniref:hypothetical protein n=1 Tax=Halolamina sp. TaxID=1940283 RepID=UPI000223B758|nr:hypothetical protein Halar_1330 [halophilic archaeon DL31]
MATSASRLAERLRQPAYTGENRCTPCTVLNTAIAVCLSAIAAVFLTPVFGLLALGVGVAAIYFRGYLVPGTPELTKRYLPDRVLRWFGKAPELPDPGEAVDVEAYLFEVGAVEETDGENLVLTGEFEAVWQEAIDEAGTNPVGAAGKLLDVAEPGVEERGDACVVTDGGMKAADWPSEAALVADLGAVRVLGDRDADWTARDHTEQGRILAGLRVFAERCPACGGTPGLGEETVESCCRRAEVFTYSCRDCGACLLEIEQ